MPASLSACGARPFHTGPWLKPSNVTVPIITLTTAIVPGTGSRPGRPPSGGRIPTTRSLVSNTLMRENRLR